MIKDKFYNIYYFSMKVYYSHAMPLYGTEAEIEEKQQITKHLPEATLVDPGSYQDNPEKRRGGMEYCLRLVEKCDALIFTRFSGKITAGVGLEINHALSKKMPVHELKKDKLQKIQKPVEHLSRDETVRLYRLQSMWS
jgi:hypothetical protein